MQQNIWRRWQIFQMDDLDDNTVRTLWLIIIAVMGGTVWSNITNGLALTGYWKGLGASDSLYGIMFALPALTNGFQFFASYVLEKSLKRQKIFVITGLIQRIVWLPLALVPLFVPVSRMGLRLFAAGIFTSISAIMMPFTNVTFYSICNDVVPVKTRGSYFAVRSRIANIVGMLIGIGTGLLLDIFPGMTGYILTLIVAAVFGTADISLFIIMKLPPLRPTERKAGMGGMLKKVLADKSYMRIVLFFTVWLFAVQMTTPYFNVYMQSVLGISNLRITLFSQIASNIALIVVIGRWGKAIDRYGSKPVVWLGCVGCAVNSLLWTVTGNTAGIIIDNILFGAFSCAYDLGGINLFMVDSKKENASMYIAVYFMFTQVLGCALGSAAGGFLLDNVFCRVEAWNYTLLGCTLTRYNVLFFVSGVLRVFAIAFLLPGIREKGAKTVREMLRGKAK